MERLIEFLSGFNIQTILSITGVMWYFKSHMDVKYDKIIEKMDEKINRLDERITRESSRSDKLYEMFIDLLKEKKGL